MFKIVKGKRVYIGGSKKFLKNIDCLECKNNFSPYIHTQKFCSLICKTSFFKPINKDKLYKINKKNRCWEWLGVLTGGGYASVIWRGNKSIYPHRYFYEDFYNTKIPKNLDLDHLCRNRKCVNPKHLEPVTRAENIRRGNSTKLNKENILKIKNLYKKGLRQVVIAKKFNINQCHVSRITNELRWSN